ncbi:MAG: hypothetical protein AB8H03_20200 [Saprospiraceae bacterium]
MKYIKYITILIFQFSLLQFTIGQTTGDNGRPEGTTPGPVAEKTATTPSTKDVPNRGTYLVDLDVPQNEKEIIQEDTYYPIDMEIAREEIMASTHPAEIAQKMNELNDRVEDLLRITEELRLENKVIRESLNNCCSNSALGLSASDAYLIQNAPNPFNASSEIRYFVPEGLENVEVQISSFTGEVLSSIKVTKAGYGKIEVGDDAITNGTFVYTLLVKGKFIDSKVMIKTK